MDIILWPHVKYIAAYLDNVVIYSGDCVDHFEKVQQVLESLRQAGLMSNPRNCSLGLSEAQYLGYQIGRGLLNPQEKKVEAVRNFRIPTAKTQVCAFLGLAGYYQRFVPNLSTVAAPLSDLTRKGQPECVQWTDNADREFQSLKQALTSEPVLQNPDKTGPSSSRQMRQTGESEQSSLRSLTRKSTQSS